MSISLTPWARQRLTPEEVRGLAGRVPSGHLLTVGIGSGWTMRLVAPGDRGCIAEAMNQPTWKVAADKVLPREGA